MHHCFLSQRYDRVYDCTNVGTMQHTENIQFFLLCLLSLLHTVQYIDGGGAFLSSWVMVRRSSQTTTWYMSKSLITLFSVVGTSSTHALPARPKLFLRRRKERLRKRKGSSACIRKIEHASYLQLIWLPSLAKCMTLCLSQILEQGKIWGGSVTVYTLIVVLLK